MASNSADTGIINICTCSKCKSLFGDPRLLPTCGHTFDSYCISEMLAGTNRLVCPECHTENFVHNVYQLQRNALITKIVELIEDEQEADRCIGSSVDKCSHLTWMKNPTVCEHCKNKFCGSCFFRHSEHIRMEAHWVGSRFDYRLKKGIRVLYERSALVKGALEFQASKVRKEVAENNTALENQVLEGIRDCRKRLLSKIHSIGEQKMAKVQRICETSSTFSNPIDESILHIGEDSFFSYQPKDIAELFRSVMSRNAEIVDTENLVKAPKDASLLFFRNSAVDTIVNTLKSSAVDSMHWHVDSYIKSGSKRFPHLPSDIVRLHKAVIAGNLAIFKELLEGLPERCLRFALEHRDPGDCHRRPLVQAILRNRVDVVKYLVQEKRVNLSVTCRHSGAEHDDECIVAHAIHLAASKGCLEIVKFFMSFSPDLLELKDSQSNTPLGCAVIAGQLDVVKYLLCEKSANMEYHDCDGCTPLLMATIHEQTEIVRCLVENGANVFAVDSSSVKYAAVHFAASDGSLEIVKILIKAMPDLVNLETSDGLTPIHVAAECDQVDVVKFIASETKVDMEKANSFGENVLLSAAFHCSTDCAKFLMDNFPNLLDKCDCSSDREAILLAANGDISYDVMLSFKKSHRKAFVNRTISR